MFLNRLTVLEKENFVSLALHAAESNEVVTDEEYAMFEEYCREMGIAFFDSKNEKPLDEVISFFKESDLRSKKIVLLEMIGLMYADGSYDELEKKFVLDFSSGIGLSDKDVEKMEKLILEYLSFTEKVVEEIG